MASAADGNATALCSPAPTTPGECHAGAVAIEVQCTLNSHIFECFSFRQFLSCADKEIIQVPEPAGADERDNGDVGDNDSALDTASLHSDTTSLRSSVTKYREENGRRYHAYGASFDSFYASTPDCCWAWANR
jgi:hypothetical protein